MTGVPLGGTRLTVRWPLYVCLMSTETETDVAVPLCSTPITEASEPVPSGTLSPETRVWASAWATGLAAPGVGHMDDLACAE